MLQKLCGLQKLLPLSVFRKSIVLFFTGGLLFAYFAEFALGKDPCILCVYMRYIFMVAVVLSIAAVFYEKLNIYVLMTTVVALSFSVFHVGVENKLWKGPDACRVGAVDTSSAKSPAEAMAALKAALKHKQPVRCDEVNWRIMGVSATIWNTLYLLMILLISGMVESGRCRKN